VSRRNHLLLLGGLAAFALLPLALKNYGVYLTTLWCSYLIAAFGLNLIVGYAGQMSLGQAAFFGIGAYAGALLMKVGLGFWLSLPLAAGICFAIGFALGFPALRVQHHYLAFATLGFNLLVYLFLRNEEWLTGGTFGLSAIPRPSLFGHALEGGLEFFYLTYATTILLALILALLLRSPWGRAFACLRDNPIRAESLGIDITRYTLLAFAIGAAFAGIGGLYFAALVQYLEPGSFNIQTSLMLLLMVIVGGAGRFFGPVLGAIIVILLPEWLRFAQNWYLAIFGFAIVALMVWLPGGLLSLPERLRAAAQR